MTRDHFPRPLGVDYATPEDRVPREISAAPPLWVELLLAALFVLALLYGVPLYMDWAAMDIGR